MNKGDIVLIPFPFTDLSGAKNRPAVILASGKNDITVAFITSQVQRQENHDVKIEASFLNGLKRDSLVRLEKLATLDRGLAIGKLGTLSQDEILTIDKNLMQLFKLA